MKRWADVLLLMLGLYIVERIGRKLAAQGDTAPALPAPGIPTNQLGITLH